MSVLLPLLNSRSSFSTLNNSPGFNSRLAWIFGSFDIAQLGPKALNRRSCRTGVAASTERVLKVRWPAIEVGKNTTSLGDDDVQRRDIEDIDIGFDHRIQLAGGQAVVVIVIAITAGAVGFCQYAPERSPARP